MDIERGLIWSQTGLTFLSFGHMVLVVAWAVGGLLEGFSNGILHVPPIAIEIILIKVMAESIGFGVDLIKRNFVAATEMKHRMIVLTCVLLVIAIIINIVHLVFTGIELNKCTSFICEANYWFLFTFAFILGFLILFEVILFWYFVRYDRHVRIFKDYVSKRFNNP